MSINHRIPKLAALSLILFFVSSVMLRLVLPFGDEPDYTIKVFKIAEGVDFSFVSVISRLFSVELDLASNCIISARPFGVVAQIEAKSCFEPIHIQFIRLLSVLITVVPLALLVANPSLLLKIYSEGVSRKEALFRAQCVLASLPFPGMVYFLGLLSVEHFTLIIGLLGFVFCDRIRILIPLLACSTFFDFGNTIVAAFFFLNLYILKQLGKGLFSRILVSVYSIGLVILFMVSGINILNFSIFQVGGLASKSEAIYYALSYGSQADLVEKYNIMLRPIISISSLVLITPAYIKAPAAFLAMLLWFVQWCLKSGRGGDSARLKASSLYFWAAIFTILLVTTTLPTYAYGKYYALCIPALLSIFVAKQGAQSVTLYASGLTLVTSFNILLFWL